MNALHIALREIKIGFRNPWSYSFIALFTVFSLSLLIINAQYFSQGYSSTTASMLNLTLYLLPLMTLLLGAFSLTAEKEEGSWQLLSTYPISTLSFIAGKYMGLSTVLLTIVAFGYGITGVAGYFTGKGLAAESFGLFFSFSAGLVLLFLAIAIILGTLSRNRWQALTFAVTVWFFAIIGWPTLLISLLGVLPYVWIKPMLTTLTLLNPAELVRLFVVVKLGGGSVLGPEYYQWVHWMNQPSGGIVFTLLSLAWILISIGFANLIWERGRSRG
ncbi:ABC transporter permease subunit [Paenibacillus sp. LMG 31456]|uniref:ABC transporter permease subunit n=1 Tax=Paenibacillus foliorum TaxID=2654974 RepID=A0A972GV92_9BACL|nr:ABC transporter permease subunit [Paenibacillus foliorum]NOU94442.1 ABC transporter permease subunit [Paenibacillus foliorum]